MLGAIKPAPIQMQLLSPRVKSADFRQIFIGLVSNMLLTKVLHWRVYFCHSLAIPFLKSNWCKYLAKSINFMSTRNVRTRPPRKRSCAENGYPETPQTGETVVARLWRHKDCTRHVTCRTQSGWIVTDSRDAVTMVAVTRAMLVIVTSQRRQIKNEYIFPSSLKNP